MVKIGQIFHVHGKFCASHPWEVIVALVTFTACMFSVDRGSKSSRDPLISEKPSVKPLCHGWRESCDGFEDQYLAADAILMTIVRCSALLYCYYQFCNLNKLGSKYILGKFETLLWQGSRRSVYDDCIMLFTFNQHYFVFHRSSMSIERP